MQHAKKEFKSNGTLTVVFPLVDDNKLHAREKAATNAIFCGRVRSFESGLSDAVKEHYDSFITTCGKQKQRYGYGS